MHPKFDFPKTEDEAELLCPSCSGHNLHHDRIEVFERGEDKDHGVHVVVDDGRATVDTSLQGNPSSRRHGLTIRFWCEACSAQFNLNLAQHKGNTLVSVSLLQKT